MKNFFIALISSWLKTCTKTLKHNLAQKFALQMLAVFELEEEQKNELYQ